MKHPAVQQLQSYIQEHFLHALNMSPVDSLTPFEIGNALTGHSEFLFLSKSSPSMYAPVKGRGIQEKTACQVTMYHEGKSLILRFEVLGMIMETEIVESKIKNFLSILLHQETITLVVLDAKTYEVVWLTNTINFRMIRFHYKEIFEMHGVI